MRFTGWKGRALGAAVLAGSLGACDFITASGNPNVVAEPTLDQLTTAVQVNAFFMAEDQISRISAIWTQQAAGTDRQFSSLDTYVHDETDADGEFGAAYIGGGLIDIRAAQEFATEQDRIAHRGMLKVYEAYVIGRTASIFGDIPYSEAVTEEFTEPKLDNQEDVYAAVQGVLDEAIADLQAGGVITVDLVYAGDETQWIKAANTLKARYYIHWAEAQRAGGAAATAAQTACGGDCIAKAIAAAENGLESAADDWLTVHSTAATEENVWSQFITQRSGYIKAGAFMTDTVLQGRGDPRLSMYVTQIAGAAAPDDYVGSMPGENLAEASDLKVGAAQSMAIATCAENEFIKAEAYWYQGNEPAARTAAASGVACAADLAKVSAAAIPIADGGWANLAGEDLFAEIMMQKYLANFLSVEAYNDYKRTCLPAITTYQGQPVPRRLYYALGERVANSNIPPPDQQDPNNENDPNACTVS